MVSVNFTLIVLLLMFLGFLWAMHRFVFRPALALSDQREDKIVEDRTVAKKASADAERLEDEYSEKLSKIHREANAHIARARRAAQEEHQAQVEAFKKRAEGDLSELRKAIRSDIEAQKEQFGALSNTIAIAMAHQLDLE